MRKKVRKGLRWVTGCGGLLYVARQLKFLAWYSRILELADDQEESAVNKDSERERDWKTKTEARNKVPGSGKEDDRNKAKTELVSCGESQQKSQGDEGEVAADDEKASSVDLPIAENKRSRKLGREDEDRDQRKGV